MIQSIHNSKHIVLGSSVILWQRKVCRASYSSFYGLAILHQSYKRWPKPRYVLSVFHNSEVDAQVRIAYSLDKVSVYTWNSESNVKKEHLWDPALLLCIQWWSILTLRLCSSLDEQTLVISVKNGMQLA